jgi:hypothetical protein
MKRAIGGRAGGKKEHTIVAEHKVAVIIRQHKDKEPNKTKQVYLPIDPACLFRENRENLKQHQLQKIA